MIEDLDIVRKATARRMKLSVDPRSGRVRLVLPSRASLSAALEWAEAHQGWIARQRARLPQPWPIEPGMIVPFGGEDHVLNWAEHHPRSPQRVAMGLSELLINAVEHGNLAISYSDKTRLLQ